MEVFKHLPRRPAPSGPGGGAPGPAPNAARIQYTALFWNVRFFLLRFRNI